MRPDEYKDKIISAHRGYFDKECRKTYKENSRELCRVSSQKDYIDLIELDVRKSKDGILYCYHGTFVQFFFLLKFQQSFSVLKKKYNVDSLSEVLEVIPQDKLVVLDLQDKSITKADILNAMGGRKFKEVILGSPSISYLERFNNMPEMFSKFMNRNLFANFYDLRKLRAKNYKYFEVLFPFQVSSKLGKQVSSAGLVFSCAPILFLSHKSYWKKVNDCGVQIVSSDFI